MFPFLTRSALSSAFGHGGVICAAAAHGINMLLAARAVSVFVRAHREQDHYRSAPSNGYEQGARAIRPPWRECIRGAMSAAAISTPGEQRAVKVLIEGRVQGVWYRGWTLQTARDFGLDGWVQNRRDGSVQAVFSGPDAVVDEMLRLCAQGPPGASVSTLEYIPHNSPVPSGFRIKPSV